MQAYVNYLLTDIAAACRSEEPAERVDLPEGDFQDMEAYFEEIERWLESEPEYTFSYYCGLEPVIFPPQDKLSEAQMLEISDAFEELLDSWNLNADIPEELPINRKYTLLVSILREKLRAPGDGMITVEFCNCDPKTCPFEEHCNCRHLIDKFDEDDDREIPGPDILPF